MNSVYLASICIALFACTTTAADVSEECIADIENTTEIQSCVPSIDIISSYPSYYCPEQCNFISCYLRLARYNEKCTIDDLMEIASMQKNIDTKCKDYPCKKALFNYQPSAKLAATRDLSKECLDDIENVAQTENTCMPTIKILSDYSWEFCLEQCEFINCYLGLAKKSDKCRVMDILALLKMEDTILASKCKGDGNKCPIVASNYIDAAKVDDVNKV